MKHIFRPLRFIKLYKRKLKIEEIQDEKEYLERLIFEALMYRGPLKDNHRVDVLDNVVRRAKVHIKEKAIKQNLALTEAEHTNDRVKRIMMHSF